MTARAGQGAPSLSMDLGALRLRSGAWLPGLRVAYTCRGTRAAEGDNAILVTHGFTSAHTMIEPGHLVAEGSWADLVGPGRPLDTDRYFVVCSNMLGSSFGTTGPGSLDPATGRPWGLGFPDITLADIVEVQHRLLQALGVTRLRAVIGPSYGGFQALQWALDHPDRVDAIGVVSSDFHSPPGLGKAQQIERLAASPQWQGGRYHDTGGMVQTLEALRRQTLQAYGLERLYAGRGLTPQQSRERIDAASRHWAAQFDPCSLPVLAGAAEGFDVRGRLHEIRARVLLVQANTDAVFPASEASRGCLARVPAPTRSVTLDSPYGHMAASVELPRWSPHIAWLLGEEEKPA
ncbi:MAG: alpha/beta fold hydrolase [Rubrivivax sp.]